MILALNACSPFHFAVKMDAAGDVISGKAVDEVGLSVLVNVVILKQTVLAL